MTDAVKAGQGCAVPDVRHQDAPDQGARALLRERADELLLGCCRAGVGVFACILRWVRAAVPL